MNYFPLLTAFLNALLSTTGSISDALAKEIRRAITFINTAVLPPVVRNLSGLESLGTFVSEPVAPFKTSSFWKTGDNGVTNLWFTDYFKEEVIDNAMEVIFHPGERLERLSLTEEMWDTQIEHEAGDPFVMSISEYLAWMKGMVSLQPKGQEGYLLTNSHGNLRYVAAKDGRKLAIIAKWGGDKWMFSHQEFNSEKSRWLAGRLVFFPATAEAA